MPYSLLTCTARVASNVMQTLVALLILATTAPATAPSPPTYRCVAATQPINIDGKLDDPAWQSAVWTSDFVDIEGADRPPPALRTRAKLLWDSTNLYLAAELQETDVRAEMRDRDDPLFRENAFELFLDPDNDGRNYLELEINALNTVFDLIMDKPYRAGGHSDDAFTIEGMKTAIHIDGTLNDPSDHDRAWTIEIAIPWKSIKSLAPRAVPPTTGSRWRINLARCEYTRGERGVKFSTWSPHGAVNMHLPDKWGWLEFVR
jgi:hypothetical protein